MELVFPIPGPARIQKKQEFIPVGCVPPFRYRTGGLCRGEGGLPNRDPPGQIPPDIDPAGQRPYPRTDTPRQRPRWTETLPQDRDPPQSCDLWCILGQRPPCGQNS